LAARQRRTRHLQMEALEQRQLLSLNPGDIAILGMNAEASGDDNFAFLALADISAGEEIKFTDNGWIAGNGAFRQDEGVLTWTAPGPLAAGTVTVLNAAAMDLSDFGDQILAYQGSDTNPVFIYGFDTSGWWPDWPGTDDYFSALPPGLIDLQANPQQGQPPTAVSTAYAGIYGEFVGYAGPASGSKP
jgi:hypothetical protein